MAAVRSTVLLLLEIFSSTYSPCFADSGTPLVLGTWFHLYVGNAIIGWLEAVLIARFFKVKFWRTLWLMVIANYVSGFVGLVCIPQLATALFDLNQGLSHLYILPTVFWTLLALLFVMTVFIEWTFVFFAFPSGNSRLRRSFWASLLAQTCSYLLLLPLYAMVSDTSLMSGIKLTQSLDFSKNKNAYVYFVGNEDNSLYKVKLDGSKSERLPQKIDPKMDGGLCIDLDNGNWLICAHARDRYEWWQRKQFQPLLRIRNPSATRLDEYDIYRIGTSTSDGVKKSVGEWTNGVAGFPDPAAVYVGMKPQPPWHIWFNSMGLVSLPEGIKIKPADAHDKASYAWDSREWSTLGFETPLLNLWCQHVILLPDDQLVFELGRQWPKGEIVLYDLHSKQLAPVAAGRSPIVLLDGATEAFTGKLTGKN
jgi:hypothetical protein